MNVHVNCNYVHMSHFCSCDLDLNNPITVTYEVDLDILKMYLHIKKKFLGQGFQKLEHKQNRHTDRHIDVWTDIQTDEAKHIPCHICGWNK